MIDLYVSFRMQLDGDMCTCAEILHVYICNETILIALCFYWFIVDIATFTI